LEGTPRIDLLLGDPVRTAERTKARANENAAAAAREGAEMDKRDDLEQTQPLSPGGEQEPQGLVPPYEGRQTEAKEGLDQHMDRVFDRVDEVAPGPGREVSDEEREGVPATDTEASSPLGVGESINRRGEDVARHEDEPGREHTGTRGSSDRPAGVSDERDSSAIDP
jgi:hypothetical protein